jgi:hypothetical protein
MSYNEAYMSHLPVHIDTEKGLPALPDIAFAQIELYLAYLETSGRKRYSAIMAGVDPGRMVYYVGKEKALKNLEMLAMQGYCELIDAAVHDRAINGVVRSIYFKGEVCGTERHYSDSLLLALAKANSPKYREHISVDANVTAGVLVVQASLDPDEWEKTYVGVRTNKSGIDDIRKKSVTSRIKDDG